MRHIYTSDQDTFIRNNIKGRSISELTKLFNNKFGLNMRTTQIRAYTKNRKLKSGIKPGHFKGESSMYTLEQREFIKNNLSGKTVSELTEIFNDKFGTDFKVNQIKHYKKNNKLKSGVDCRFKKGQTNNYKIKGISEGFKINQFRKGNISHNTLSVGSEVITIDGYTKIKIGNPNKWKYKHIFIWEKSNGAMPEGHVIIFADKDKSNFNIDNLILISKAELLTLNRYRLIKEDAELTKTGLVVAKIYRKISERSK